MTQVQEHENIFIFDYKADAKPTRDVVLPPTKAERRLWNYYRLLGRGREFYRSLDRIAGDLNLSKSTVQRANRRFKALGLLTWESGHGNRQAKAWGETNRYIFLT